MCPFWDVNSPNSSATHHNICYAPTPGLATTTKCQPAVHVIIGIDLFHCHFIFEFHGMSKPYCASQWPSVPFGRILRRYYWSICRRSLTHSGLFDPEDDYYNLTSHRMWSLTISYLWDGLHLALVRVWWNTCFASRRQRDPREHFAFFAVQFRLQLWNNLFAKGRAELGTFTFSSLLNQ